MIVPADLSTAAVSIPRVKYFPIELSCAGMLPNTTYDIYLDGIPYNSYCKPFGGNLGSPLVSNAQGRLIIQMHIRTRYNQQRLVDPSASLDTNIMTKVHTVTLIDPFNNSSIQTIPITLKAGALT